MTLPNQEDIQNSQKRTLSSESTISDNESNLKTTEDTKLKNKKIKPLKQQTFLTDDDINRIKESIKKIEDTNVIKMPVMENNLFELLKTVKNSADKVG